MKRKIEISSSLTLFVVVRGISTLIAHDLATVPWPLDALASYTPASLAVARRTVRIHSHPPPPPPSEEEEGLRVMRTFSLLPSLLMCR